MTETALIPLPELQTLSDKTKRKLLKIWQEERDKERLIDIAKSAGSGALDLIRTISEDEIGRALIVWSTCYGMAYGLKKVNKNSAAAITILSVGNAVLISKGIESIVDILNPFD